MKVIFYNRRFVLGGMENAVYHLARLFISKGIEIEIVTEESDKATQKMLSKYSEICKVSFHEDKEFSCDVLIDTSFNYEKVEFIKRDKRIHWLHSCRFSGGDKIDPFEYCICQSRWQKGMLDKLGITSIVITNPLDVGLIRELSREPITDFHFPTDKKIFLMVCRISPEKGWDRAIEFMKRRYNENNLLVVIGGIYFTHNNQIRERLIQELKGRVAFIGEKSNPYPYMLRANYICSFSDHETYGFTTEEAHILGKPVVFNRYETAQDQFIQYFDHWIDQFMFTSRITEHEYNNLKNEQSLEMWLRAIDYEKYG